MVCIQCSKRQEYSKLGERSSVFSNSGSSAPSSWFCIAGEQYGVAVRVIDQGQSPLMLDQSAAWLNTCRHVTANAGSRLVLSCDFVQDLLRSCLAMGSESCTPSRTLLAEALPPIGRWGHVQRPFECPREVALEPSERRATALRVRDCLSFTVKTGCNPTTLPLAQ